MKSARLFFASLALACIVTAPGFAEEGCPVKEGCPVMPSPGPEHAWLQQLVGNWDTETEAMAPGQPPIKSKGTEVVRSVGGFWTISEIKGTMMDKPFTGNLTLGYDPSQKQYVGTWVDSMTGQLWKYDGSVDASGKVLTLNAEGSCPMNPGKPTKFRETLEIKDPNHTVFTSAMLGENGQWMTMMTSHAHRAK